VMMTRERLLENPKRKTNLCWFQWIIILIFFKMYSAFCSSLFLYIYWLPRL
jgi:hypothetical protein